MKQSTHHQEEIRPILIKHLADAVESIHLAIGWIDEVGLEGLLRKKAFEGVEVILILIEDENYQSKTIDLQNMMDRGVEVIRLDERQREHLIDHKFGVIDGSIVLTGNYAWGFKNAPKEENVAITEGVSTLANGFESEFDYLSNIEKIDDATVKPSNPIIGLLKKIEVVKTLLGMGDTEFIQLRFKEFENFIEDENIALIHQQLLKENYEDALELIKNFIQYHQPLRQCLDPPIDSLKREIQMVEEEIATISTEYSETQKILQKFSKMHTDWLGGILQDLLFQTKKKSSIEAKLYKDDEEKQAEYEEAKKDHEEYTKSYELSKEEKVKSLTKEEQRELKKLYRFTSMKCHPDRVVEELHDQAEEIFIELNEAYKANDLERVREINQQLKSGIMLSKSEGITELKKLESTYKTLIQKLEGWQEKLNELQKDPSYKAVSGIENWETYFNEKKDILEQQLERLTKFNEENAEVLKSEK